MSVLFELSPGQEMTRGLPGDLYHLKSEAREIASVLLELRKYSPSAMFLGLCTKFIIYSETCACGLKASKRPREFRVRLKLNSQQRRLVFLGGVPRRVNPWIFLIWNKGQTIVKFRTAIHWEKRSDEVCRSAVVNDVGDGS